MASASTELKVQPYGYGKTEPVRHIENHLPCIWGDQFSGFSLENSVVEAKEKEIEGLKQEVRAMLMDGSVDKPLEKIDLINSLCRLGVSYHFEKEIYSQLEKMFMNLNLQDDYEEYDLYTTSLHFRVFRQHGFKMSCDVFNKFKESSSGNFKESLATDINGMLSLYEALQLRLRGEDVLEEAVAFTVTHLKGAVATSHISPLLKKQVTHALWQPLHHGIPRIETRFYLSVYEEEDESQNQLLLKFAKLDYNLLQLLHKRELSLLSKWWKNMEFLSMFPYDKHVRVRLVESYFFALALCFEPCYSLGRMMLAKYTALITVADDIYDGYGTIEELQLLTDAIDKWELKNCMDQLPDYMKPLYGAFVETFKEFNDELMKDGRSYSVCYTKESIKKLFKVYFREATWFKNGHIPPFEEYMEVANISCTVESMITTTFMGMAVATKKVFEWLQGRPKILEALEVIGRLHDDVVNTELEPKATAVHCYIQQYGVSEKEGIHRLWEMVTNAWKDMNEELLMPTPAVPLTLLWRFFNLAQFMNATFKNDDGFDHPKAYTKFINDLLLDLIPV